MPSRTGITASTKNRIKLLSLDSVHALGLNPKSLRFQKQELEDAYQKDLDHRGRMPNSRLRSNCVMVSCSIALVCLIDTLMWSLALQSKNVGVNTPYRGPSFFLLIKLFILRGVAFTISLVPYIAARFSLFPNWNIARLSVVMRTLSISLVVSIMLWVAYFDPFPYLVGFYPTNILMVFSVQQLSYSVEQDFVDTLNSVLFSVTVQIIAYLTTMQAQYLDPVVSQMWLDAAIGIIPLLVSSLTCLATAYWSVFFSRMDFFLHFHASTVASTRNSIAKDRADSSSASTPKSIRMGSNSPQTEVILSKWIISPLRRLFFAADPFRAQAEAEYAQYAAESSNYIFIYIFPIFTASQVFTVLFSLGLLLAQNSNTSDESIAIQVKSKIILPFVLIAIMVFSVTIATWIRSKGCAKPVMVYLAQWNIVITSLLHVIAYAFITGPAQFLWLSNIFMINLSTTSILGFRFRYTMAYLSVTLFLTLIFTFLSFSVMNNWVFPAFLIVLSSSFVSAITSHHLEDRLRAFFFARHRFIQLTEFPRTEDDKSVADRSRIKIPSHSSNA